MGMSCMRQLLEIDPNTCQAQAAQKRKHDFELHAEEG